MSSSSFYTLFNDKVCEWIDDLINVFPNEPYFPLYKTLLKNTVWFDKTLINKWFKYYITPEYRIQIINRNDQFFLQESYQDAVENEGADLNFINKLKELWYLLKDHDKEMVWRYIQCLLVIDNKIPATA
jgi:hypothetical protein